MYTLYQTGITFITLLVVGESFQNDDLLATEPHFTVTETTTERFTTASTSPSKTCSDRIRNCDAYGSSCLSTGPILKWARYNCAKSCGLCDDVSPSHTTAGRNNDCTDKVSCHVYESTTCTAIKFREWAFENCRSYCGLCDHCSYNGLAYKRGETWQDGCSYNCTCLGRDDFNCTPRCKAAPNFPRNCYFVNSTVDACCKDVVCRIDTQRGQFLAPYKNGHICQDKLSNCGSFPEACAPDYKDWARKYCALTCNRC